MGKKVSDFFDSKKFFSGVLVVIFSTMLVGNSRLGAIEEKADSTSLTMSEIHPIIISTIVELAVVRNDVTKIINEQSEIKPMVLETRQEQISRTKNVACMGKIMDVMGCDMKDHP